MLFINIDNNQVSACLFLDYSKVFNIVDQGILLEKLKLDTTYSIEISIQLLIISYLKV